MKKYILGLSMMFAVIIIAIAACSKSGSDSPKPTDPNPTNPGDGNAVVSIKNFAFSPASVTIKAGKSVTWTNADTAPHTATDNNGEFDSGNLSTAGTYSHTFKTAGTYTYICKIHSSMTAATVVVTN